MTAIYLMRLQLSVCVRWTQTSPDMPEGRQLTSGDLAVLIADSLVGAGLLVRERLEAAIKVIALELDARKGVGDY